MIKWIKSVFVDENKSETEDLKNQCDLVLDKLECQTQALKLAVDDLYEEDSSEIFKEKENEEVN